MLAKPISIISIFVILNSCTLIGHLKRNRGDNIRIVDINGKYKPIKLYTPRLNVQILAEQNKKNQQQEVDKSSQRENIVVNNNNPKRSMTATQLANADLTQSQASHNIIPTHESIKKQEKAKVEYDMSGQSSNKAIPDKKQVVKKDKAIVTKKPAKKTKGSKSTKKKSSSKSISTRAISTRAIFVQVGSYSSLGNAKTALFKNKKIHKGKIEKAAMGSKKIYRVLLGPMNNSKEAKNLLKKVAMSGYGDAFITKK
jgi:hypothetical protein